jgi:hypothetical protein
LSWPPREQRTSPGSGRVPYEHLLVVELAAAPRRRKAKKASLPGSFRNTIAYGGLGEDTLSGGPGTTDSLGDEGNDLLIGVGLNGRARR